VSGAEPAQPLRFAAYAAIFGKRDMGGDIILPGAFATTLARRATEGKALPLLWQHRPDIRLGTIEYVAEDAKGLRVVARFDRTDNPAARALLAGKATGVSLGYRAIDAAQVGGNRELRAVDLFEVSLVTHPMQPFARVHLVR